MCCYVHPLHSMFLLLFVHTLCPLLHHCPPGSPFFLMMRRPPRSALFPSTTLFRSSHRRRHFRLSVLVYPLLLLSGCGKPMCCNIHPLHPILFLLFLHTRCPLLHHCPPGSPLHHCTHPLRSVE